MNPGQQKQTIFSDKSFRDFFWMMLALLSLSAPLLFLPKENISVFINSLHHPLLDSFFYYITYLGDGLILLAVVIFLLFRSYTWAAVFSGFAILEAVFVQLILKKGLFRSFDRPAAYIPNFEQLHQVEGISLHHLHSFPSGHTQTIFLAITFLVISKSKGSMSNFLLILIASLTGLSRVYLLQHFFIDIWFGALIGFGLPVIGIYLWQRYAKFPPTENHFSLSKNKAQKK